MKNIVAALLLLIWALTASSQSSVKVNEITANMSKGMNSAFEVEIPQAGVKDIERDWKHRLLVGNKARVSEINGEISARGVENKEIAAKPYNVYGVATATTSGVKLTAWFTYNDTVFFSTNTGNHDGATAAAFVRDFAAAEYFLAVKNAHQSARDKLEKMKDDLERSIRIQEKGALRITENKRAIARAQDDLLTNDNDQKDATAAVNLQQAEVNKVRNGNAEIYKAADKDLRELQDEQKRIKNRNEELHRRIDELNKENATEDRNITTAKQDQAKTADAIEKQKVLVAELAARLKTIK